jgi:hypothetical protein
MGAEGGIGCHVCGEASELWEHFAKETTEHTGIKKLILASITHCRQSLISYQLAK